MNNKIFIISLNPAIDYVLNFENFIKNKTNRPYKKDMYPAGKGIHVSMILNSLKYLNNESIIFIGGDFQNYFTNKLNDQNIKYKLFQANGDIRINLKIIDSEQTEASASGPEISQTEINKMFDYLKENVKPGDYIIANGSLPLNMSEDIYAKITSLANELQAKCVIDAFGLSLTQAIKHKPFLIKPNVEELEMTLKTKLTSKTDIKNACLKLIASGVENILVSMGSDGAMFVNKTQALYCPIYNWNNKLVNAAGAGDSMLGGFIETYINSNNFEQALKFSIICGSGTAYSQRIASSEMIQELAKNINDLKVIKI
ncbi:1-phosphofructokinase family hexose kinase [Spiroplasma endosymbiont of Crioceris asparagi]|uniref:1-phosphofructokinase family hexose kinase n=1 Tax=Spiroplasma endosymbiont of Crioceris asparagi TaxID=3066286 RepID=UPI0030CA9434